MSELAVNASRSTSPAAGKLQRLYSLDVFRGVVMLLLIFFDAPNDWTSPIVDAHPAGSWPYAIVQQFRHVEWSGLVLWDMVQPAFMFAVGASAAFSYASRSRCGDSYWSMFGHACYRALLLILLGVFLR